MPNEEHNQKEENKDSENIYITGDNLDGLKHLLKSYAGKVKCIYIDPPYNTGSDGFVYNDNFNFTVEELTEKLSIGEEEAKRILDLTKRGSASHSAWLMFMYPRLQLAYDLLKQDGVIFVSIDDNEQANLKLLCDDIFGEHNFIETFIWKRRSTPPNDRVIGKNHEYILAYAKSIETLKIHLQPRDDSANNRYKNPDNDPRGRWAPSDLSGNGKGGRLVESCIYPILNKETGESHMPPENKCWLYNKEKMKRLIKDNRIGFREKSGTPFLKRFLSEVRNGITFATLIEDINLNDVGTSQSSAKEIRETLGDDVFEFPKPVDLIEKLLITGSAENDIILDFFSGSATTAIATNILNCKENSNRKYIMLQLPEKVGKNSVAYRNGYRTIDEIGQERIVRVANKIKEDNPNTSIDLGFKHFTLNEPTSETINKLVEFTPKKDEMIINNTVLDEFGVPTVITTWLNNDGYGLTTEAENIMFAGYEAYYKDKHLYLVHPELPNEAIEEIVVKYETDGNFNPENIVLFGYSFTWTELESLKTNLKRLQDTEKNLRINFDVRY